MAEGEGGTPGLGPKQAGSGRLDEELCAGVGRGRPKAGVVGHSPGSFSKVPCTQPAERLHGVFRGSHKTHSWSEGHRPAPT